MAKMIGSTTFKCVYGCCRDYGNRVGRTYEKRSLRKREKMQWKREVWLIEEIPA